MGKFQLNKKGEDPIKIYEDTFKIANDTVETHLGKLGKMPNPISREAKANEVWIDIFYYIQSKPQGVTYEELKEKFGGRSDFEYFLLGHIMDGASRRMAYWDGKLIKAHESKAKEVNGKYVLNGMVIGKVTDFEPKNWFGKVELSAMPEFAEFGTLDPQAVVKGDDGVTYKDPKGGSDGSRGTLLEPDGNPMVNVTSYDEDHKEDFLRDLYGEVESIARERLARDGEQTYTGYYSRPKGTVPQTGHCPSCGHDVSAHSGANTGDNLCYGGDNCDCGRTFPWIKESKASEWKSVEAIAKEAISEDEKDDIFQYLFDLQESGITNMFGAGPYVEREFPHLDKKEVRDVVLEWMKNYETIHARMGIESRASEGHELDDQSSDFQYHKADSSDLLRTDQPIRNPDGSISDYNWDHTRNPRMSLDLQDRVGRADYREAIASEDYGNMNIVQNPDLDTDGYPMDQEGFARANWDDASIEDRKNWLFKAGYDSERGDEYEPYFSLDSHIRAQLAKDLQIGGIYAMGTGSL